ncbi:MAG TPA: DUF389 domain-containing protein [Gaiellaceae bacterium]|nr:DUF389 domain-containing protein [Gaiellaceae bacterium]HXV95273.1 DUF389 domain-containing protein [Gaiellaceae bacterium]
MFHVRVIAPAPEARRALQLLEAAAGATNVVHHPAYARKPVGDLVAADVAREAASVLLADLAELGIDRDGAVTVIPIDVAISPEIAAMRDRRAGAVVWEQVAARSSEWTELDGEYLVFMALAAIIAVVGLLTDSVVLIIGAMILGPDFGPLAGTCVALATRHREALRRSLVALVVGFAVAVAVAWAFTELTVRVDLAPGDPGTPVVTEFVSHPNRWSIVVALAAGVAGILSLTTVKSGALVGVLISITTIPALANMGLSAAYRDWDGVEGSALQLAANVASIVAAGVATLAVQRALYRRRVREHRAGPGRRAAGLPGG